MTLKPHKACDAKLDKIKKVMWVMPKLDGVRALHVNGDFQSRTLTAFPNVNLVAFNRKVFWGLDG